MHVCVCVGLACLIAWDRLIQNVVLVQDVAVYNSCLITGGVYAAALAALAIVSFKRTWLPQHRIVLFAIVASGIAGLIMTVITDESASVFCVCIQSVGAVILLPIWARILCACSWRNVIRFVSCAVIATMAIVLMARWYSWLLPVLLTLTPIGAGVCALYITSRPNSASLFTHQDAQDSANLRKASANHANAQSDTANGAAAQTALQASLAMIKQPFPWPFLSVFALSALVAQFFAGVVAQPYAINSGSITLYFSIITMVMMVALALWAHFSKAKDVVTFFFPVLLLLIAGLLLFSTGVLNSLILPIALVYAAANCLYGMAWIILVQLVQRFGLRTVPSFAVGMLIAEGTIGMYAGIILHSSVSMNFSTITSVSIISIALFTVFYIVSSHLHQRTLRQTADEAIRAVQEVAKAMPEQLTPEQTARAASAQRARTADEYGFTARERQIVPLVVQGMSNGDIAAELIMSESTVKFHLKNIYAKCNVHSRSELSALFRV